MIGKRYLFFSFIFVSITSFTFVFTNCGDFQASGNGAIKTDINSNQIPDPNNNTEIDLDNQLNDIIQNNQLTKLSDPKPETDELVELGKILFNDTGMSQHNDVACATCHVNELGSADGLPLPIGSGGVGVFPNRRQINGQSKPMPRHAPAIFNKGREGMNHALWDGRLQFILGVPSAPVEEISGPNHERTDITQNFENAFDIQPLFPLITPEEFFGFDNDLSDLPNTPAIWDALLKDNILVHEEYRQAFTNAYPNTPLEELTPGHISRAVRAFLKINFQANNTPFDQYLDGDLDALTSPQKRGMIVFYGQGRCNVCHSGPRMTNDGFYSLGLPHLGFDTFIDDHGREDFTKNRADRYKFKTTGIRNVKLSGPYMHNGVFETLEQVIDHKNDAASSIKTYEIPSSYQQNYEVLLNVDRDEARNQERLDQMIPALQNGLGLSPEQKADLLEFISEGLLDTSYMNR